MQTCGQCEYYLTKMDECPHPEKRALDKACDKLEYTNPRNRIDYLQERIKELEDIYLGQIRVIARSRITYKERVEKMVVLAEQALEG